LGALATYLAWTVGLGAAVLEWIDSRRQPQVAAIPPAPEPGPGEGLEPMSFEER
jgi:hypothetical protein